MFCRASKTHVIKGFNKIAFLADGKPCIFETIATKILVNAKVLIHLFRWAVYKNDTLGSHVF